MHIVNFVYNNTLPGCGASGCATVAGVLFVRFLNYSLPACLGRWQLLACIRLPNRQSASMLLSLLLLLLLLSILPQPIYAGKEYPLEMQIVNFVYKTCCRCWNAAAVLPLLPIHSLHAKNIL
jgi:hypothetical protein